METCGNIRVKVYKYNISSIHNRQNNLCYVWRCLAIDVYIANVYLHYLARQYHLSDMVDCSSYLWTISDKITVNRVLMSSRPAHFFKSSGTCCQSQRSCCFDHQCFGRRTVVVLMSTSDWNRVSQPQTTQIHSVSITISCTF